MGAGVSVFSSYFGFSCTSSSAAEFAAKAYSTAASFASKSACFAAAASFSSYAFLAAFFCLAYSSFFAFLSSADLFWSSFSFYSLSAFLSSCA